VNLLDPTIYLVDDDRSVLKALSRLLRVTGFDNVITYDSPRRFIQQCNPALHGCIVMDVAMPDLNGLELQEALAAKGAALPIIFLTGRGDIPMSVRALKRGAIDFLTKPVQQDQLASAVRTAIARDREQRQARAEANEILRRLATLTPREYQVLERVVAGRLNKQAAFDLGISEKTIKVHRARMMEKMQVQSLAELVQLTERAGVGSSGAVA